ncbi:MAG: hypothetical protein H6744_14855 [Deltaproteobacteria bacterium]|nr:hypothetical protein [Deltaproteobacteria bacterium]
MKIRLLATLAASLFASAAVGCDEGSTQVATDEAALTLELPEFVSTGQPVELSFPVQVTFATPLGEPSSQVLGHIVARSPDMAVPPAYDPSGAAGDEILRPVPAADASGLPAVDAAALRSPAQAAAVNPGWATYDAGQGLDRARVSVDLYTVDAWGQPQRWLGDTAGVQVAIRPSSGAWQTESWERTHVAQGPMAQLLQPLAVCGSSDTKECTVHYEVIVTIDPSVSDVPARMIATVAFELDLSAVDLKSQTAPVAIAFE